MRPTPQAYFGGFMLTRALVVTLSLFFGGACKADQAVVTVGGTRLVVPIPEGLVEAKDPGLRALFSKLVYGSNRVLTVLVTPEADAGAAKGNFDNLGRYVVVQTPGRFERLLLSPVEFDATRAALRNNMSALLAKTNAEATAQLNARLQGTGVTVRSERPAVPEIYADEPDHVSFLHVADMTVVSSRAVVEETRAPTGTTVLHLRGKLLFLYTSCGEANSIATGNCIRELALEMAERTRKANR